MDINYMKSDHIHGQEHSPVMTYKGRQQHRHSITAQAALNVDAPKDASGPSAPSASPCLDPPPLVSSVLSPLFDVFYSG